MPAKQCDYMKPDYEIKCKEKAKQYYLLNKMQYRKRAIEYEKTNYKYRLVYKRENWRKNLEFQKLDTFKAMGNRCCVCNFFDKRALQIDHVKGNAKIDKNASNNRIQYLRQVKLSYLNKEGKYQLLCANCNWIKKHENRESTPRAVIDDLD